VTTLPAAHPAKPQAYARRRERPIHRERVTGGAQEHDADKDGVLNKEEYVSYLREVLKDQHEGGTTKIILKAVAINFVLVPLAACAVKSLVQKLIPKSKPVPEAAFAPLLTPLATMALKPL